MRPIPSLQKASMANDPFYETCCLERFGDTCSGRIEWHHNLILGGRQSNERWSILPVCHKHHMEADKRGTKEKLNWVMLNRATNLQLIEVSKAINYQEMRDRLNKKYG